MTSAENGLFTCASISPPHVPRPSSRSPPSRSMRGPRAPSRPTWRSSQPGTTLSCWFWSRPGETTSCQLKDKFEKYKTRAQSILRSRGNKVSGAGGQDRGWLYEGGGGGGVNFCNAEKFCVCSFGQLDSFPSPR